MKPSREYRALNAYATLDGLWLRGHWFSARLPLAEYTAVLGHPSRTVEPAPPAPYSHRNNQIHIYDELGIYLNEHHAEYLIQEVVFVLESNESPFPIEKPISEGIRIGDAMLLPGMKEQDYPARASIVFDPVIRGTYATRGTGGVQLTIHSIGRRTPSGQRTRQRYFVDVSISFNDF